MHSFSAAIEMPQVWPSPPDRMSFSTLTDIEACPLRWGLSKSMYSSEWGHAGYPAKPNMAAFRGIVVHASIETVVQQTALRTETNFGERITSVLRGAGGLSAIVDTSMRNSVAKYEGNPRAVRLLKEIEHQHVEIRAQARVTVQTALRELATLELHVQDKQSPTNNFPPKGSALSAGVYSEIALNAKHGWYGIIDLLIVDELDIRLEDFKTGTPKEDDAEQLLIYAWLWWADRVRNPAARLPGKLMIRYPGQQQTVPIPSLTELQSLETNLLERTKAIRSAIQSGEFLACPSGENCRYCTVRQLCDDYWNSEFLALAPENKLGDVEAVVIKVLSPRMWQLEVIKGFCAEISNKVYVRGSLPAKNISEGSTVRLLDVNFETQLTDADLDEYFLQLTTASEIYWLIDSKANQHPCHGV